MKHSNLKIIGLVWVVVVSFVLIYPSFTISARIVRENRDDVIEKVLPMSEFKNNSWWMEKLKEINTLIQSRDDITQEIKGLFREIASEIRWLKDNDPKLLTKIFKNPFMINAIDNLLVLLTTEEAEKEKPLSIPIVIRTSTMISSIISSFNKILNFYTFIRRLKSNKLIVGKEYKIPTFPIDSADKIFLWNWTNKIITKGNIPNGEIFSYALSVEDGFVNLIVKIGKRKEMIKIARDLFLSSERSLDEGIGEIEIFGEKLEFILTKAYLFDGKIPVVFGAYDLESAYSKMVEVERIYEVLDINVDNVLLPIRKIILHSENEWGPGITKGDGRIFINIDNVPSKIAEAILHESAHNLFRAYEAQGNLFLKKEESVPLSSLPESIRGWFYFHPDAVLLRDILDETFAYLISLDFNVRLVKNSWQTAPSKETLRKDQISIEDAIRFLNSEESFKSMTDSGRRFLNRLSIEFEIIKQRINEIDHRGNNP